MIYFVFYIVVNIFTLELNTVYPLHDLRQYQI